MFKGSYLFQGPSFWGPPFVRFRECNVQPLYQMILCWRLRWVQWTNFPQRAPDGTSARFIRARKTICWVGAIFGSQMIDLWLLWASPLVDSHSLFLLLLLLRTVSIPEENPSTTFRSHTSHDVFKKIPQITVFQLVSTIPNWCTQQLFFFGLMVWMASIKLSWVANEQNAMLLRLLITWVMKLLMNFQRKTWR